MKGGSNRRPKWQGRIRIRLSQKHEEGRADELAALVPFGDPRGWRGSPEQFRWLAHRWLTRVHDS